MTTQQLALQCENLHAQIIQNPKDKNFLPSMDAYSAAVDKLHQHLQMHFLTFGVTNEVKHHASNLCRIREHFDRWYKLWPKGKFQNRYYALVYYHGCFKNAPWVDIVVPE